MASAHNNLGVVYAQTNRRSDAIRHFRAALAIDPNHVNAQRNLNQALGR